MLFDIFDNFTPVNIKSKSKLLKKHIFCKADSEVGAGSIFSIELNAEWSQILYSVTWHYRYCCLSFIAICFCCKQLWPRQVEGFFYIEFVAKNSYFLIWVSLLPIHNTGCNQRRKVIPKYTQIGYFTLDLDDAKEYLYAKSTKRRILSWRDIHVNVFIWIKTMSPHSFGCEDFFVLE